MSGLTGLLEGLAVLAASFGGLIWIDRRTRAEPRRRRDPRLPPRELEEGLPAELERPVEREAEIRDHLYGETGADSGVISTRRVSADAARPN